MPTPTHTDIPSLIYDMLRAVHASRAYRANNEAVIRHLPNSEIFQFMPDHKLIDWSKESQPALVAATLRGMATTLR